MEKEIDAQIGYTIIPSHIISRLLLLLLCSSYLLLHNKWSQNLVAQSDKGSLSSHFCGNSGFLRTLQSRCCWGCSYLEEDGAWGMSRGSARWQVSWCWLLVDGRSLVHSTWSLSWDFLNCFDYKSNSWPGKLSKGWSFIIPQNGLLPQLHILSKLFQGAALCQEVLQVGVRHVLCPPVTQEKVVQ